MVSITSKTVFVYQLTSPSASASCKNAMIPHRLVTLVLLKLWPMLHNVFGGPTSLKQYVHMSPHAPPASELSLPPSIPLASSIPSQYQRVRGPIFPWTWLLICLRLWVLMGYLMILSAPLCVSSLNRHFLYVAIRPSLPTALLTCSLTMFTALKGCLQKLSLTVTPVSPLIFGKHCFHSWAVTSIFLPPTTPKLMANRNAPTVPLNKFCGPLSTLTMMTGLHGCRLLNLPTITPHTPPPP